MKNFFFPQSVFGRLLMISMCSTLAVTVLLVVSLLRMALELPRPYLSSTLLYALVEQNSVDKLVSLHFNGASPISIPEDQRGLPVNKNWIALLDAVDKNIQSFPEDEKVIPFGAVIKRFGMSTRNIDGYYYAGLKKDGHYIILPPYAEPLSNAPRILVLIILFGLALVVTFNFYVISRLTRPFGEVNKAIRHMHDEDLAYRIPLEKTFGEYKTLATAFNTMTEKLARIYEARRYLLLAISHELRTPLTRLKIRKDLIPDETLQNAIRRDINTIEYILDSIAYTEHTMAGVLRSRDTDVPLGELLDVLCMEYAEEGKTVTLQTLPAAEAIMVSAPMLGIVLRNLLDNAFKHGKVQEVWVEARQDMDEQSGASCLLLAVRDAGDGIEPEKIPLMTDIFWRDDPSRDRATGGFGLGLYICSAIVANLRGSLSITSNPGHGTRVKVQIPAEFSENIRIPHHGE